MKLLLSALVLICSVALSWGEGQQFTFALPELDGRISLGVFDSGGKLVRTLAVSATETDFTIGLNGLTTAWDGKNDAGEAQPAGKYIVRGFVVGEGLKSEGEAFHFNDWVDSEETALLQPNSVFWANGDVTYLSAFLHGSCEIGTLQYTEKDGLKLLQDFPEDYRAFKTTRLDTIPKIAEANGLSGSAELSDANAAALIISDKRKVWLCRKDKFEVVPLAEELEIHSISAGMGETFWVQGRTAGGGAEFVRQYAFGGEILRELTAGLSAEGKVFADKGRDRIFLTEPTEGGKGWVIRGMQPAAGAAADQATADWEVFLEKSVEECGKFGVVDGKLVANAGEAEQNDRQKVVMKASSLTAKLQSVTMQVVAVNGEVWLQTGDGLRLSLIGKLPAAYRCVVRADGGSALHAFAGNGMVVAEYKVEGLKQLAEIDAGEIELP